MKATGLECPCSSVVDPYERKLKCKPNHFFPIEHFYNHVKIYT